ncbi:MAG: glycosyltransferase family 2 protein [Bacteroidetes bacterium]|nr:glycosyltransferase family 2 protein [Bacteroidota bacterium]
MNHSALVSICVPTFNGAQFLNSSLESILKQTYTNIEVVISDDNSKDETLHIANEFKQKGKFPVFIHKHIPNGIGENWNNCIRQSNGKYIKLLFQDDILEPNCIEEMVNAIENSGKKICICKRAFIVELTYLKSKKIQRWMSTYGDLQKGITLIDDGRYKYLTKSIFADKCFLKKPYNKIGEPIVGLIDRSVFDEIGYYNTSLKQILDYEFWYRALLKFDFVYLELMLVKFRIHFSQTTQNNYRNRVREIPTYFDFIENNLIDYLDPKDKKKRFAHFKILIKKIFTKK